jgi:arginine/ornithine transport system substrate-binding protein
LHLNLDGTVADHVEVTGGFLSKPEGKDFELKGDDLYITKYFGTGAGIGLRKGQDPLKVELSAAIKAIRGNGVYKKINDKYFKFDVYGK